MKNNKLSFHVLVDLQDGAYVAAPIAVVWRGPNCDQIVLIEPVFEAVHDQLVGASYDVQAVDVIELASRFVSKEPACPAR